MVEVGSWTHYSNSSLINFDEERFQDMIIDQIQKFKPWTSEFEIIMNKINAMESFNNASKVITDGVQLTMVETAKQQPLLAGGVTATSVMILLTVIMAAIHRVWSQDPLVELAKTSVVMSVAKEPQSTL